MTLAYYGKSRKRGVGLALAAILAIILGTVGAVSLQGGSARAADETTINLSDSACVSGGASFHFNAPQAAEGAGAITVGYTINSGGEQSIQANETSDSNGHPDWTVVIAGSGTIKITSATAGSLTYSGNGSESATISCGESNVTGSVTVNKVWLDASGTETSAGLPDSVSFTATGTGMSNFSLTSADGWSAGFKGVSGDVAIVEQPVEGWKVVGVNCHVAASGLRTMDATNGGDASFTVDGEAWTCTFTNQKLVAATGTLTVVKHVVDAPQGVTAGDFTLTVSQNGSQVGSDPGSETGTSYTLPAGTYMVAETGPTGFSGGFSGACGADGSVTVTAGETATCTLTNTYQPSTLTGSITINKHFVEADGTTKATDNLPTGVDFTYTGADGGGSFTLNSGNSWTWNLPDAPVGYYHFDEASIPGWHTVDVHCYSSAVTPRSAVAPEADASFTLKEGESWTCDFTNQRVEESSQTYTVTVEKYISDALATTGSFSLSSTTTASNVPGCESGCTNPFTLDSTNGWMATTTDMAAGSQYSVVESGVAASAGACTANDTYYLAGYKMGATLADAQAAPLDTSASITDLQSNMYVIVVNQLCAQSNVGGTITINKLWQDASGSQTSDNLPASLDFSYTDPNGDSHTFSLPGQGGEWTWTLQGAALGHYAFEEMAVDGWHTVRIDCHATPATMSPQPVEADGSFTMREGQDWTCDFTNQANSSSQTYTVTIAKYISGNHATAADTNSAAFNMQASWTGGSGTYDLDADGFNGGPAYEATTAPMAAGTMYATNETGVNGAPVPMSPGACTADTPYYLAGYRVSSTSMADAAGAPLSTDSPNFTNLQSNQYVIVVNQPCQAQNLVGSITIVKSWEDANGDPVNVDSSQVASFTGTGTGIDSSFDLTNTSMSPVGNYSHQFFGLANGTYTFTESPIDGWTLTGITCAGNTASTPTFNVPDAMLSIDFVNTEGMTCTFHNQQQAAPSGASLTIVKEWHDVSDNVMTTGFGTASFTSDVSGHESFMLGTNNTGGSNQLVISGITPGTYHITEAGQAGWTFVSATCSSNAMQNPLAPSTSFGVVVPENGNITCTVVNQANAVSTTGSITLVKQWQDANGNVITSGMPDTASFTGSGDMVSTSFDLTSAGNWTTMFSGLGTGTFGFNESPMTGWELLSATCTDNANSNAVVFGLNTTTSMYEAALAAGQNITCTFVNRSANTLLPSFPVVPIITTPSTPTASPSASPSATLSPSATTTTTPSSPTTVPTNTGNASPSTNTGNTGVSSQPSNVNNNAPSANNAVAGVQAPGAPSTGSGSAMGSTGNTLAIALGLVTIAASAAAFAFSRKNRS